ncbi:hypothetical protein [uncultured Cohaesibacter sp.]|uniref:hypothetical protein n=1 Tax=uncultured Cohaesibacter sp. TaxID=1002546 RepID=UPI00293132E3|nr:hypothetical protein [uncultured Cohaesibacter sp.]
MARPGKTIFDATMMAGWALAAVLIGLVALTMVDDKEDSPKGSGMVAMSDKADTRLVTGSIDANNASGNGATLPAGSTSKLLAEQNQTYDPFAKRSEQNAQQLQELVTELKSLKREVDAFHVTTKRLRDENDRLKQRLAKIELGGPGDGSGVRVVALPRQNDSRSPFILNSDGSGQLVDPQSTGSIAPTPEISSSQQGFDPFKKTDNPVMRTEEQPFVQDVTVAELSQSVMLPRSKPEDLKDMGAVAVDANGGVVNPPSEQVAAPLMPPVATSQTAFGLDMGPFISLTDIRMAWREISGSQRDLVGDLKPLSRVSQRPDKRLAINLILGPIQNAAQAATLCAKLKFANYDCKLSPYRGEVLAMN